MTDFASKVIDATLEQELGVSFGRYARATILARAIPDVRDGLKPVQRRIVYAMTLAGNTSDKRYRKCAKTVGDVMGSFHPHGDSSIYDAMVRMAQHWKMRHPHVDGHGNFGSIDDDPPAAMRYTEARLAGIADELTRDIKKNTVTFQPTFDDSDVEPTVLPARFPNLLVNGTSGVSTGFATEIQPHNLGECIDALIALIDDPELELHSLMQHIKGPDFPTGGIMMGREGLEQAYETGKGRVVLRARTRIEDNRDRSQTIVINEIPYGVIKANLVRDMEKLRTQKVVQGIKDVRDESDREGLRIVIDLKKGVDPEPVRAFMFKKTDLQVYRHFQMVAIVDRSPALLSLKAILEAYLAHQRDVVTRRSQYDLDRAEARRHIVHGLIRAVDVLDEVIAIIRGSKNRAHAHERLMATFDFSDEQTKEILDLRLHRLTGLQILQLKEELKALDAEIALLKNILGSSFALMECIRTELLDVRRQHADERRTTIVDEIEDVSDKIKVTVTVKAAPVMIGVSKVGYVKRSSMASFGATEAAGVREEDAVRWIIESNTLHRLVLFSAKGKAFAIPVHQLPEAKWGDVGTAAVNVVDIDREDRIVAVHDIPTFETKDEALFVTRAGAIKRTPLTEFDSSRSSGVAAMKVGDDEVLTVLRTDGTGDYFLATFEGNAIRFPASEVPSRGRGAGGVRGMRLNSRDHVVSLTAVPSDSDGELAVITAEGRAKRTVVSDFPCQHRGGRGVRCVRKRQRLPHRVVFATWWPSEASDYEQIRLLLSDFTQTEMPVKDMQNASRDGNGYEYFEGGDKIRIVDGYLLGVRYVPPEGEEGDGEPDGEGGDDTTEAVAAADAPQAEVPQESSDPDAEAPARGGWARGEDVFLPGLGPQGEDVDGED